MRRSSAVFLQVVVVLAGVGALAILVRFPLTEGRAAHLDLFSVYADPFLVYGYLASIVFFIALHQAFTLLGHVGHNRVFSLGAVSALRTIKRCAIILSMLIVIAALYVGVFHAEDDDPAGFVAVSIVTTLVSSAIATAAAVFEKTLQTAVSARLTENAPSTSRPFCSHR